MMLINFVTTQASIFSSVMEKKNTHLMGLLEILNNVAFDTHLVHNKYKFLPSSLSVAHMESMLFHFPL